MMTHVKFRKGAVGTVHHHPHRQVTYIERGSFEVFIGKETKVLKAGDCYFIPPYVNHGVVALEDSSLVDVFAPARTDFLQAKEAMR
jgi:quercetin dioxygenase-like cupin family protein